MKVLQFAFSTGERSTYLPYFYPHNCVVYTGTHDNDTTRGWYETMDEEEKKFTKKYLNNKDTLPEKISWDFIRLALRSVARLAVIPFQDYLGLGDEARINEPSTLGKNWRWRMDRKAFTPQLARRCRQLACWYGRCGQDEQAADAVSGQAEEQTADVGNGHQDEQAADAVNGHQDEQTADIVFEN